MRQVPSDAPLFSTLGLPSLDEAPAGDTLAEVAESIAVDARGAQLVVHTDDSGDAVVEMLACHDVEDAISSYFFSTMEAFQAAAAANPLSDDAALIDAWTDVRPCNASDSDVQIVLVDPPLQGSLYRLLDGECLVQRTQPTLSRHARSPCRASAMPYARLTLVPLFVLFVSIFFFLPLLCAF